MSVVIYTPAIALSAVTEITPESSVLLIGGVCIVLSTLGGLKAVMWADVFQAVMMYACLFILLSKTILEVGGFEKVYQAASEGGRLNFFNAALWSTIPSFAMGFLTTTLGLALFAIFRNCDPLNEKSGIGLTKVDQIVPYYIVSRLHSIPGLVGLCVSGILCASLSSLSSALNSLSTVFVEDFIRPSFSKNSNTKLNALAKCLVIVHGLVIIGLAFMTSQFTSVLQAVIVLDGMVLGPTLGVYILGVFTEKSNELGVLIGLSIAALFSAWFGLGTSLFGNRYEGLPLSNENCNSVGLNETNFSYSPSHLESEATNSTFSVDIRRYFPMHNMSYIWTYCIGAALTILIGYIASRILSGYQKNPKKIDSKLLCTLVKSRRSEIPKDTEMHSQTTR